MNISNKNTQNYLETAAWVFVTGINAFGTAMNLYASVNNPKASNILATAACAMATAFTTYATYQNIKNRPKILEKQH